MKTVRWACPAPGSPRSQQSSASPRCFESRSMSCPAQLCSRTAFAPPTCTLTLERTSLPPVKTSVTVQAGDHPASHLCHMKGNSNSSESQSTRRGGDHVEESLGAPSGAQAVEGETAKSDEYSDVMQQRMGSSLTYRHEEGINFANILDDLMVGSCLQTTEDVDR